LTVNEVRKLSELLEPGVEVSIENCFPEKVGEKCTTGVLDSLSYEPGSDTYRVELGSGEVYTVTSTPEDYDINNYVAEPEGISVLSD
jgi:hypothetical protein